MTTIPKTSLLLFFTTPSSGPARRMEGLLAQLAHKERDRLRIVTVDAEKAPELTKALGVGEIPTLLLLRGGRPVARLEGRASGTAIEDMLRPHLRSRAA